MSKPSKFSTNAVPANIANAFRAEGLTYAVSILTRKINEPGLSESQTDALFDALQSVKQERADLS